MKKLKTMNKVVVHALVALVLGSPMIAFAQHVPGKATPAEQLAAAYAKLYAFKSHRERRVYEGGELIQNIEFSGGLEHWISLNSEGKAWREVIWDVTRDKGRSAERTPPGITWTCHPRIPAEAIDPPSQVTDGGALMVNGQAAHRFVEVFTNIMADSHKRHEVDVATDTGIPIRLISTEVHKDGFRTHYVGTYYDIGVPIVLVFPHCP